MPLKPFSNPKLEGGNVIVEVDDEEYRNGVEDLKYSVVGHLLLPSGGRHPTTVEIMDNLKSA